MRGATSNIYGTKIENNEKKNWIRIRWAQLTEPVCVVCRQKFKFLINMRARRFECSSFVINWCVYLLFWDRSFFFRFVYVQMNFARNCLESNWMPESNDTHEAATMTTDGNSKRKKKTKRENPFKMNPEKCIVYLNRVHNWTKKRMLTNRHVDAEDRRHHRCSPITLACDLIYTCLLDQSTQRTRFSHVRTT